MYLLMTWGQDVATRESDLLVKYEWRESQQGKEYLQL